MLILTFRTNRKVISEVFGHRVDSGLLLLAFGLGLAATQLTFVRWYRLVRALGLPFSLADATRLGFTGIVYNIVVPGGVGGDVARAAYLCREQSRRTLAVSSMLVDRIVGLVGLFLLASVAGLLTWASTGPQVRRLVLLVWACTAAGVLGLAIVFQPALFRCLRGVVGPGGRLGRFLGELDVMATGYRSRLDVILLAALLSAGVHSLNVLAFYSISRSMLPGVGTPSSYFLLCPLIFFTTAVPLPYGALGFSEQVGGALFRMVSHPGGAVAMLGFRVIQLGILGVAAVAYLRNYGRLHGPAPAVKAPAEPPAARAATAASSSAAS